MPFTVTAEIAKDISIGIALTSFLFTITVLSPIFGFFCTPFIPLPTLYYRTKLGRKYGVFIPALTMILLVVMLGGVSLDIVFFFELLLIGFIMGEIFELKVSVEKTVVFTCAAVIVTGIVFLSVHSIISATSIINLASEYIRKNLELTIELYKDMGMSPDSIGLFTGSLGKMHFILVRIVPALVITSTLFIVWACLIIARPLLIARNLGYPDFGPLNRWKAPEHLVWAVIGCGLMLLIPSTSVKLLAANGLLIMMTIYFFQGIAIVAFYFDKKRFPRLVKFILYTLIAVQQLLLLVVIGLGFFDVWVNFRKLKPVQD